VRTPSTFLAALLTLTLALAAHGQGANTLQGRVIAPDGNQPTNPVKVTLTYSGRRVSETFTDLSGRYYFAGLGRGNYQVTAEGDGRTFVTTSVYAEVSGYGSSGVVFTQDIQLRPLPGRPNRAPAGVVNAFSQEVPKAARERLDRARKLADEGKGEAAMVEVREAIRIFPRYFDAHLMLGNYLVQTGHLEEAIPELDLAREVNPNDERVYQSFGLLLMKQRKYPIAVAVFTEATRLNPTNPVNFLLRASGLIYQTATIEAAEANQRRDLLKQADLALAKAAELSDKKAKIDSMTLAMFYELKGEPSRAADELEGYLKTNPGARNAEVIQKEIARLRLKSTDKTTP
jgi:tetratricopeptide (TPR) repeat protein